MRTHSFMSTSKTPNMGANEDKWFVYADGPDAEGHIRLHMHRSWTSKKMIELIIKAGAISPTHLPDGSTVITGIVWESDSRQERSAIGSWMSNYKMKPWDKSLYPNFPLFQKVHPTLEWLIQAGNKFVVDVEILRNIGSMLPRQRKISHEDLPRVAKRASSSWGTLRRSTT
jgi:hypothetical protein